MSQWEMMSERFDFQIIIERLMVFDFTTGGKQTVKPS